jgi:hypothetical protein
MDTTVPSGNESTTPTGRTPVDPTTRPDPDNPALNTYAMVKARFEKTCFRVDNPFCFVRTTELGTDPQILHWGKIQSFYNGLTYWETNKRGQLVKKPFVYAWLHDDKQRRVESFPMENKRRPKLGRVIPQERLKMSLSDAIIEPRPNLDDPAASTYEMVKAWFENTHFKINNPFTYAEIQNGYYGRELRLRIAPLTHYCDLYYTEVNSKGNVVRKHFAPRWLKDPTKRTVETLEFNEEIKRPRKRAKKSARKEV